MPISWARALLGAVADDFQAFTYLGGTSVFNPKQVAIVGGQFGSKDLERVANNAPGALISMQGMTKAAVDTTVTADLVCVLASKGAAGNRRALQIVDMVSLVMSKLAFGWVPGSLDCVGAAVDAQAENLYTPELDTKGVALWAVAWKQDVDLIQIADLNLDDFLSYYADYAGYEYEQSHVVLDGAGL